MDNYMIKDYHSDYLSAVRSEEAITIQFNTNILPLLLDLHLRDKYFDYLDLISKDKTLKVVILNNKDENIENENYLSFFQHLFKSNIGKVPIHRFCNVIDQYITKIIQLDKYVISLHRGNVFFLYFYIGLACDHRIIAKNTIISSPCLDYGLPLKPAGAIFLSSLIGRSKTFDLIFSPENTTAVKALELGIVDQVVEENDLENKALEKAKQLNHIPVHQISSVKRLVNFSLNDLESYLEVENKCFFKNVSSSDLWIDL